MRAVRIGALVVGLAVFKVRRDRPSPPQAFRTPGGALVPTIAVVAVLWLLSHSTRAEIGAIATVLGAATIYYLTRARRNHP